MYRKGTQELVEKITPEKFNQMTRSKEWPEYVRLFDFATAKPGEAPTPPPKLQPGEKQAATSGFLRGLSLQFADEIMGIGDPKAKAKAREEAIKQTEETPISAIGGEVLGGIAPYAAGAWGGAKLGSRLGPYGALAGGVLGAGAVGALESVGEQEDVSLGDIGVDAAIAGASQLIGGIPFKKGAQAVKRLLGVASEAKAAERAGTVRALEEMTKDSVTKEAQARAAEEARDRAYAEAAKSSELEHKLAGKVDINSPKAQAAKQAEEARKLAAEKALQSETAKREARNVFNKVEVQPVMEGMASSGVAPAAVAAIPGPPLTPYEADLIKQIAEKEQEILDIGKAQDDISGDTASGRPVMNKQREKTMAKLERELAVLKATLETQRKR